MAGGVRVRVRVCVCGCIRDDRGPQPSIGPATDVFCQTACAAATTRGDVSRIEHDAHKSLRFDVAPTAKSCTVTALRDVQ